MSVCAPEFTLSTKPGEGVQVTSYSIASTASEPTVSANGLISRVLSAVVAISAAAFFSIGLFQHQAMEALLAFANQQAVRFELLRREQRLRIDDLLVFHVQAAALNQPTRFAF